MCIRVSTPINKLKLGNIRTLIKEFPEIKIGLSDHFNGILTGPLAAMLGATVFEKHVTFDRAWKRYGSRFCIGA